MILQAPGPTFAMTHDQLKTMAAAVSGDLRKATAPNAAEAIAPTGGGSRQRGLPEELRHRFIEVRAALFQRGVFDPILVRFDTATVPQASTLTIADALAKLADAL